MTLTIERQKGESAKLHHRLMVFATVGEQNYEKTADILNEEMSEMSENDTPHKPITVDALMKNAERRAWRERIELASAKQILAEAEEMDEQFRVFNKKIIKILEGLIEFIDKKLQRIYRNYDDYALTTQMNLLATAMNILDKAIYNYRLSMNRSTDNHELKHDVQATVKEEKKLIYPKEVRERIQNISDEPDEETQEFLDKIL